MVPPQHGTFPIWHLPLIWHELPNMVTGAEALGLRRINGSSVMALPSAMVTPFVRKIASMKHVDVLAQRSQPPVPKRLNLWHAGSLWSKQAKKGSSLPRATQRAAKKRLESISKASRKPAPSPWAGAFETGLSRWGFRPRWPMMGLSRDGSDH